MYQIDVPSAVPAQPVASAPGVPGFFTDGSVMGGVPPTVLPAEFLNVVMMELLAVVAGAGLSPSKGSHNQLLQAIEYLIEARAGNYVADVGVVNAFKVVLSPPVSAYVNGLPVKFRAAHGNTAGATLDAGAGPVPLLRDDGLALSAADVSPGSVVTVTYDAAAGAFLMDSIVPSQFGALAALGVGDGLVIDGAGNLSVDRRSDLAYQYFNSQN